MKFLDRIRGKTNNDEPPKEAAAVVDDDQTTVDFEASRAKKKAALKKLRTSTQKLRALTPANTAEGDPITGEFAIG